MFNKKPSILFFLLFSGFIIQSCYSQEPKPINESMPFEAFKKKVLEPKDEVWVIDFWASWCGPCVRSLPHLVEVKKSFEEKNVQFVSISWDKKEGPWRNAINRFGLDWPQIWANKKECSSFIDKHFPHKTIPSLFIVTKKGKVKRVSDMGRLEKMVQKELNN